MQKQFDRKIVLEDGNIYRGYGFGSRKAACFIDIRGICFKGNTKTGKQLTPAGRT